MKTFTQMTPIPLEVVKKMDSATSENYENRSSGFAVLIGAYMGEKMNVSVANKFELVLFYKFKGSLISSYSLFIMNGRKNTLQWTNMTCSAMQQTFWHQLTDSKLKRKEKNLIRQT